MWTLDCTDMDRNELRLTADVRYEDVELGQLVLTSGQHRKAWKAIWQTNMKLNVRQPRPLPRGRLPLRMMANVRWTEGIRVKVTPQAFTWIEPLETTRWMDFGNNIYLYQTVHGGMEPIGREAYQNLAYALVTMGISSIWVTEPDRTEQTHYFKETTNMLNEKFWEQ